MKQCLGVFLVMISLTRCNQSPNHPSMQWPAGIIPPVAEKMNKLLEAHGDQRTDEYYWLNQRGNPAVMNYLLAENKYFDTMMAGSKALEGKLYAEMKGRVQQRDETVPYKENGYWYYVRYEEGKQYPVFCRKQETLQAPEEVMLDQNKLSTGYAYFDVGALDITDNNEVLAYTTDTVSRRLYTVHFKNLHTGDVYPETIINVDDDAICWAADNKTIFYIRKDTTTLLGYQVWRHVLGTDALKDVLVYEEKDNRYYLSLSRSKSKKYIRITADLNQVSTEIHLLRADQPNGQFIVFQPRQEHLVYYIEHFEDKFYIRTDWKAPNFRLMVTAENKTAKENWTELMPNRKDVFFSGFILFKNYLVLEELKEGRDHFHVLDQVHKTDYTIPFDEPAYAIEAENNRDFNSPVFRFQYTSLTTPPSVFDFNLETKQRELKKETAILEGFKKEEYVSEVQWATARDGKKIPVSIVYKKGLRKDGNTPLLLYAYGSYGYTMVTEFNSNLISLLNRGFVYAIAHVRGEQKLGREWYNEGHLLNKKNTFTDYIDCAEYLVKEKYTSPAHLYANGRSAGGLLMGAITNMRPDLWHAVVAEVPFVDVITSMSDPSIPLTTGEYEEWGNPADSTEYFYMKSYSPYDNVMKKAYPNLLVTTAFHDSQVQYFEPAKWVAKLRALKTDRNVLLFRTDMHTGHGGASGRFDSMKDEAMVYTFLLTMEGITE